VVLMVTTLQVSSTGTQTIAIRNSAGTEVASTLITRAASDYSPVTVVELITGLSGSTTRKASAKTSAGTVTIAGATTPAVRSRLIVFDAAAA
jgi:hypothetical protein